MTPASLWGTAAVREEGSGWSIFVQLADILSEQREDAMLPGVNYKVYMTEGTITALCQQPLCPRVCPFNCRAVDVYQHVFLGQVLE